MRVAFVSNVVYPFITGGAEKRIHEIGTRLGNKGHDITIYSRQFWEGPAEIAHEGMTLRALAPEADLYSGDRRSISEAVDFAVRALPSLRRYLRDDKHDIVVASVFPYFPVLSAKLAGLFTGTPLVTTWHEVWGGYWEEYIGHLAPFGKFIEYITAQTPQHPIAISYMTADRLAAIGPAREDIRIVPNGINVEQVKTAPPPESGYDVLFAGRLVEHKNVDILLDAFDEIANRYNITLGIVGDGPERERLESKRESLTHDDCVEFLGFLNDHDAVLGHMNSADIFASPSTREGFGITFVEAMAADCTVIAANHSNSTADEVIGDAGFFVNPTVGSLTKMLDHALSGGQPPTDPIERAQLYDWDEVADKAETAYKRAVNGSW